MSINRGEINPLGVLGLRKLSFVPDHFTTITTENKSQARFIEQWIESNLNSRYAITNKVVLNSENKITTVLEIGLEDPKEITLLTLGCHYLHKERTF